MRVVKPRAVSLAFTLLAVAAFAGLDLAGARATLEADGDSVAASRPSLAALRWAALTAARLPVERSLEDSASARWRDETVADDHATVCGWVNTRGAFADYGGFRRYLSDGHHFLVEDRGFRTWPAQEAGGDAVMVQAVDLIEKGRLPGAAEFERTSSQALAKPTFQWYWKTRCAASAVAMQAPAPSVAAMKDRPHLKGRAKHASAHAVAQARSPGSGGKMSVSRSKKSKAARPTRGVST